MQDKMANNILSNEVEKREEILYEFVNILPRIRKSMGVSQTLLGEKVGLSRQTISLIERKSLPLTWNNYLAIIMFFAMNSEDVFYFPRKRGYIDYDLLKALMHTNNKSKIRRKHNEENDLCTDGKI